MRNILLSILFFINTIAPINSIAATQAIIKADIVEGQSSTVNFLKEKGHFEKNVNGVVAYADSGSRPTDGTGGSPTITCTRTASSPISGDGSLLITKDAANRQGQGCSIQFTIDNASKAKVLQIEMDYRVGSGTFSAGSSTTDSDLIVYMYDVTNSTLIEPTSIKFLSNSTTLADKFVANFQTSATGTTYNLIIHSATTSASAYTVLFDNIEVKPSKYVYGTPISDWTQWTPTGSWTTNTTYTGFKRRVGGEAEYRVKVSLAGAPNSTSLTINLPSGEVIDTTKLVESTAGNDFSFGQANMLDAGNVNYIGNIQYATTTSVQVNANNASGTFLSNNGAVTQASPATWGSGDSMTMKFSVPIVGWPSSVQVSDSYDGRQIGFRANNSSTSINSTPAKIVWTNVDKDDVAGYSSGTYTVRSSGWYDVSASLYISGTPSVDQTSQVFIYRNGAAIKSFTHRYKVAAATTTSIGPVADSFFFNSGDTIEIYASSELASAAISSDGTRNTVFIGKRQSPTTISATDLVSASYRHSSNQSLTSAGIIIFNDKLVDSHNAYNTSTGIFTAPYSGVYEISFQVLSINATQQMTVAMRKNSSTIVRASGLAFFNTGTTIVNNNQTTILHPLQIFMNAGETFDVYNTVGVASGTVYNSGVDSWLTIKRVK